MYVCINVCTYIFIYIYVYIGELNHSIDDYLLHSDFITLGSILLIHMTEIKVLKPVS